MDTERTIIAQGKIGEVSFAELNQAELDVARFHVEITRHLQEIHHLYLVFRYNIECLTEKYQLMANGNVLKNKGPAVSDLDYIAINAMVNNLISSGRTLTESMECYVKENVSDTDIDRNDFLKFYHDTYDSSFPYRLLIRMRDYSQHGHLPVNQNGDWYGFDLYQVLKKPHYNHNKQIKQQLERVVTEVKDVYGDIPRLSLAMTIAEYTANLLSIYKKFWECVEPSFGNTVANFKELVAQHPENVNIFYDQGPALFMYDLDDEGQAHMVPTNDDPLSMFSDFKDESHAAQTLFMSEWEQLRSGTIYLRVVDKKYIEIWN